jgi:chromosome segregation ATPase
VSEKITKSDSELYNDIVEMLSNGNFLQLNGKAINLEELNNYINAQQQEIERLQNIIREANKHIEKNKKVVSKQEAGNTRLPVGTFMWNVDELLNILRGDSDE